MVTSEDCEKINLFVGGTDLVKTVNNPVQNKWYKIYGRKIATVDKPYTLHVEQGYADEIIANGKVIKVKNIKVFLLNSHLSKLTDEQLAYMASTSEYWKGIKSVQNPKIVSRGKNKFDGQLEEGYWSTSTGEPLSGGNCRSVNPTLLGAGDYRISNLPVTSHDKWAIKYDLDMNFIGNQYLANGEGSNANITMQQDGYLHFYMVGITSTDAMIQIESGLETSSYTPYVDDEHLVYGEFQCLPNGVCDDLEYQRVKTSRLREIGINHITTTLSNVDIVRLNVPSDLSVGSVGIDGKTIIEGYSVEWDNSVLVDTVEAIGQHYLQPDGLIVLVVEKGEYPTVESAIGKLGDLEIHYQLAEPIKKSVFTNLTSYESGDIIMTSDFGLIPEITFNTPVNQGAMLKDVVETAKENNDLLQGLKNVQSAPINLSQDEPVKTVTLKGQANPKVEVKGRSLTNLIGKTDNVITSVSSGVVIGSNLISIAGDGVNYKNAGYDTTHLTVGEEYLVIADIIENSITGYFSLIGSAIQSPSINIASGVVGHIAKRFVVKSPLNPNTNTFLDNTSTGFIKYKNIAIYKASEIDKLGVADKDVPYIEGTQETQDILIERRGENLVDPIMHVDNLYYLNTAGGRLYDADSFHYTNYIQVIGGETYTWGFVNSTVMSPFYFVTYDKDKNFIKLISQAGGITATFDEEVAFVRLQVLNHGDSIDPYTAQTMLVKGDTLPDQYIPPELDQIFIDEYLGDTDKVIVEGSIANVERDVTKPIKLFGTEYSFTLVGNHIGHKRFACTATQFDHAWVDNSEIVTRFDGKNILKRTDVDSWEVADVAQLGSQFFITIPNEITGMSDSYTTPTQDEINAIFNGWIMKQLDNNLYTSGDKYWAKRYQGIGTAYPLPPTGILVESATVTGANECPKEKAYGDITETYTLRYKLATPETYTIDLDGVLGFKERVNHISIRTGVRREKVKSFKLDGSGNAVINSVADGFQHTAFDKKAERITKITSNGRDYSEYVQSSPSNSYGTERILVPVADVTDEVLSDIEDMYVTYETLPSENNSGIFTATATYTDSTVQAVESLLNNADVQAKRLSTAETELEDLKNIEVYEPTLLNGWSGTVKILVTSSELHVYINDLIGGNSGSVAFVLPSKPFGDVKIPLVADTVSRVPIPAYIFFNDDGNVYIRYSGAMDEIHGYHVFRKSI